MNVGWERLVLERGDALTAERQMDGQRGKLQNVNGEKENQYERRPTAWRRTRAHSFRTLSSLKMSSFNLTDPVTPLGPLRGLGHDSSMVLQACTV